MSRRALSAKRLLVVALSVVSVCPATTAAASSLHFPQAQPTTLPGNATTTSGGQVSQLSVTCPSAGDCEGVGYYAGTSATNAMTVGETNDSWGPAGQLMPLPSGATGAAELNSVSCVSPANCVAVGSFVYFHPVLVAASVTNVQALVANETDGVWGPASELQLPSGAYTGDAQYGVLESVACTSAENCVAVGSYLDGSEDSQAMIAVESNGVWGQAIEPALPTHTIAALSSVSCSGAGVCVAGGEERNASGADVPIALTESSSGWSTPATTLIEPPANASTVPGTAESYLNSVSCPASGDCEATGEYAQSGSGVFQAMTVSESGGVWSPAAEFDLIPPGASGSPLTDVLNAVSCTSVGNCVAAGGYGYIDSNSEPMVAAETNGAWTQPNELTLPSNAAPSSGQYSQLDSVSCTSSSVCVVSGRYTDAAGDRLPIVDTSVPPLAITTTTLPYMSYHGHYTAQLAASGGAGAYTWSLTSGSLPGGLSLNASTGAISGTPTNLNPKNFTITVSDSESPAQTASAGFAIRLKPFLRPGLGSISVGRDTVMMRLTCPARSQISCDGTLSLTVRANRGKLARDRREQLARAKKTKTLIVGVRGYAVRSGHHKRLVVRLNGRGRRLLNGRGTLVATLTATPSGAAPAWSRRITFG
jgi:hypothetical protein